jgi:photosystem II stability/assembly factor-like uncharacterized protein
LKRLFKIKINDMIKSIFLYLFLFINISYAQTGCIAQNIPPRSFTSINFVNNLTGYIISSEGFIEKTTNGGNTWMELSTGLSGVSFASGFFTTANLGTANFGNKILTTTNGGMNWIYAYPPCIQSVGVVKSAYTNSTTGFADGVEYIPSDNTSAKNFAENSSAIIGYLYKTTNTGNSWFKIFEKSWVTPTDYYVNNNDSITILSGILYKTTDGGKNWDTVSFRVFPQLSPRTFTSPYKDTIYVAGTTGIIRSTDKGETWNYTYTHSVPFVYLKKISFLNSKTGYCTGDDGTILYTSNAGLNWIKQNTNTTADIYDIAFINKDTIYAVGDNGVLLKTVNGGLTNVSEQNTILPSEFSLQQNYPNPFNPSTVINYQLTINTYISLNIYDATGRLIKVLENGYKQAGNYQTNFSAEGLSSGVYYYSLYSDGVLMDTKKAIILK